MSELRYVWLYGQLEIWQVKPNGRLKLLGYAEPFDGKSEMEDALERVSRVLRIDFAQLARICGGAALTSGKRNNERSALSEERIALCPSGRAT